LSAASLRQGRIGEAIDAARRADDAQQLARALSAAGRLEEAARAYEELIQREPKSADALAALGRLRLRSGDAPAAEALLRRALKLSPAEAPLHAALGDALHRRREFAPAEAAYRLAIELDPVYLIARLGPSELLRESGGPDEAEAVARAAREIDDQAAGAHVLLGMARKAKGRARQAKECFERAVALEPRHRPAVPPLVQALPDEERRDGAEQQRRAALRARPDEPVLLTDLGMVLTD